MDPNREQKLFAFLDLKAARGTRCWFLGFRSCLDLHFWIFLVSSRMHAVLSKPVGILERFSIAVSCSSLQCHGYGPWSPWQQHLSMVLTTKQHCVERNIKNNASCCGSNKECKLTSGCNFTHRDSCCDSSPKETVTCTYGHSGCESKQRWLLRHQSPTVAAIATQKRRSPSTRPCCESFCAMRVAHQSESVVASLCTTH